MPQGVEHDFISSLVSIRALKWRVGVHAASGGFVPLPAPGEPGPRLLQVEVAIYATPNRRIERIELLLPETVRVTDWKPMVVDLERTQYVYCRLPEGLRAGPHRARLAAYEERQGTAPEFWLSPVFVVEIPE